MYFDCVNKALEVLYPSSFIRMEDVINFNRVKTNSLLLFPSHSLPLLQKQVNEWIFRYEYLNPGRAIMTAFDATAKQGERETKKTKRKKENNNFFVRGYLEGV